MTHDAPATFPLGTTIVTFSATDSAGNTASASANVLVQDSAPPVVTITGPRDLDSFNTGPVVVTGTIDDPNATVTVNGIAAISENGTFRVEGVELQEGPNQLTAVATDLFGNTGQASVQVSLLIPPQVTILQPGSLSVVNQDTISVSGTVNDPTATVEVNGISATINGGTYTVNALPIREGNNVLTAAATASDGVVGTASVQVTKDSSPPMVTIETPTSGSIVTDGSVTVSGMINDLVVGTVNGQQAQVIVNGIPALVSNRHFLAADVPLSPGANTITVVGTDQAGNMVQASIGLTRQDPSGQAHIALVNGNNQTATILTALPAPLRVILRTATGSPVVGQDVIFRVTKNNGTINIGTESGRALQVTTDMQGEAQVNWTLGSRAGAGNQVVEASSVGFAGKAIFTALTLSGGPIKINLDNGNNQTAAVGRPLPRPLVAVVTDEGHNRLEGVPVTFSVVRGGTYFNGQSMVTVSTDSDGRAVAVPTLGIQEGIENTVIEANFSGNMGFPAAFRLSGRAAGDPVNTRVSGVVLDNTNQPIEGVTVHIDGTSLTMQTDDQGQFLLASAPVGQVMLEVDGSTAQRPGTWPHLEFELVTIAGHNNTVGMPIYLLPLDIPNGLAVTATTGGTLTLPHVPGFSLTVEPGAATFPDGGQSGTVSVTMVHADKIPMTPNFGQQPRFIITVQPAGVQFQPPAALALPNTDGLPPGVVTEMYSFDHDLGQFVSIGTGSVSEDGSQLVADTGVGIIKGGWHCGGNPDDDPGCASGCQECKTCNGSSCDIDPAQDGNNCSEAATENNIACCTGGRCTPCEQDNACLGIKHVCGAGQGCQDVTPRNPKDCNDDKNCTIDKCTDGNCSHVGDQTCVAGSRRCVLSAPVLLCQLGCFAFPAKTREEAAACITGCSDICNAEFEHCLDTCEVRS